MIFAEVMMINRKMTFLIPFGLLGLSTQAFASDLPSCNDIDLKEMLLNRFFEDPKEAILSGTLAYLLMSPDDQNISLWKTDWKGRIENVRQDRLDADSNTRFCRADILVDGGRLF